MLSSSWSLLTRRSQPAVKILIGKGIGIHWPDLDEDISVSALLK
jgi:hypothetical protein